jgi:hypothetical protein
MQRAILRYSEEVRRTAGVLVSMAVDATRTYRKIPQARVNVNASLKYCIREALSAAETRVPGRRPGVAAPVPKSGNADPSHSALPR